MGKEEHSTYKTFKTFIYSYKILFTFIYLFESLNWVFTYHLSAVFQVREGLDLAGLQFVDQMVVYSTSNQKCPWYFSEIAFWFFSIILLSWPLRLLCELRTAHVHYQISKLFGTNYLRLVTCHVQLS